MIILIPVLEQMTRVTLRTITMNIPSQKIITKDNVSIDIAAVAYYHIVDPTKSVIAIENVNAAINQISQTTVRNVVGQFSLDQLLSQTLDINAKIKDVIDGHTEPWGAQVTAVEIKDITLPDNMQRAMAKEAEAERERRAKIVAAEGEFQAAVKLGEAADIISQHPVALQLRTLQTMAEISVEKNSTIIFPAQFMTTVQEAIKMIRGMGLRFLGGVVPAWLGGGGGGGGGEGVGWMGQNAGVNLKGAFLCSHRAAHIMARKRSGVIINMSSGGATKAHRGNVAYDASKGGMEAMTRAMALDLAPYGVRVNAVVPGLILTYDLTEAEAAERGQVVPMARLGTPDDVAGPTVFLATDDARYMTGACLVVDGGVLVQQRSAPVDTFPVSGFPKFG